MIVNDKKFYRKMKSKSLLSTEKKKKKKEIIPHDNCKKLLF